MLADTDKVETHLPTKRTLPRPRTTSDKHRIMPRNPTFRKQLIKPRDISLQNRLLVLFLRSFF